MIKKAAGHDPKGESQARYSKRREINRDSVLGANFRGLWARPQEVWNSFRKVGMGAVISFLLLFVSVSALGQVQAPGLAKCKSIYEIKRAHEKWKDDFDKFIQDYDSLPEALQYSVYDHAIRKVSAQLTDLDRKAGISIHDAELKELAIYLRELDAKNVTKSSAKKYFKTQTPKLSGYFEDDLVQAESLKECESWAPDLFPKENDPSTAH